MIFTKIDGVLVPIPECEKEFAEVGTNVEFEGLQLTDKKRTLTQNKAMHKYFELLADALNDAGLEMKKVLKEETEIPWTKESVKIHLWKPVQAALEKGSSTTELKTNTVDDVYMALSRHMSSKLGVNVEFPSLRW